MAGNSTITVEIEISAREQGFLDNLGRGIRPTEAGVLAGWSQAQAGRLLEKRHIQALIRRGHANLTRVIARLDKEAAERAAANVADDAEGDDA